MSNLPAAPQDPPCLDSDHDDADGSLAKHARSLTAVAHLKRGISPAVFWKDPMKRGLNRASGQTPPNRWQKRRARPTANSHLWKIPGTATTISMDAPTPSAFGCDSESTTAQALVRSYAKGNYPELFQKRILKNRGSSLFIQYDLPGHDSPRRPQFDVVEAVRLRSQIETETHRSRGRGLLGKYGPAGSIADFHLHRFHFFRADIDIHAARSDIGIHGNPGSAPGMDYARGTGA